MRRRSAVVGLGVVLFVLVVLGVVLHGVGGSEYDYGGSGYGADGWWSGRRTSGYIPPPLPSLNGTVVSLGGEEITRELWWQMRDFNAGDPAVKPYVEWLRAALAPRPDGALKVPDYPEYGYRWFDDRYEWSVPMPSEDNPIRLGVVELPFGAGLIVSAYQVGGGITIVVHGTIINETGWRELLARTYAVGPYRGDGFKNVTWMEWVLWRISLRSDGSYLEANDTRVAIRNIVVLLEMPIYYLYYDPYADRSYHGWLEPYYWDVIAHPALALAIHLASPSNPDIIELYRTITYSLTRRVVLTGVKHPGNILENTYITPFLIRESGRGVCDEQSSSTSLFASNALGAYTAYITISSMPHAISAIMRADRNTIDTDGDGMPDAIVLVDTARLSANYISTHIKSIMHEYPLTYVDRYLSPELADAVRYTYFLTGVVDSILGLPSWLKAPWLDYTVEVSGLMEKTNVRPSVFCEFNGGRFVGLDEAREKINRVFSEPLHVVPPGVALGLNKTKNIPVIRVGTVPELKQVSVTCGVRLLARPEWDGDKYIWTTVVNGDNITVVARNVTYTSSRAEADIEAYVNGELEYRGHHTLLFVATPGFIGYMAYEAFRLDGWNTSYIVSIVLNPSENDNSGGDTGSGFQNLPPADVDAEVYAVWDRTAYKGSTVVDNITISVLVYKYSGEWVAEVWINDNYAYSGPIGWSLPDTVSLYFTYIATTFNITVHVVEGDNGDTITQHINATIVLAPTYTVDETPWGPLPIFDEYRGSIIVNQTNITVTATYKGRGEYTVTVFINGSRAYDEPTTLPATLSFTHYRTTYTITVKTPEPPALNASIQPELVPVDTIRVALPNGTLINMTLYNINETIKIGNTTVVVYGYVTRLRIDIDIYVFGVPPANYTTTTTGLQTNQTTEHNGALHTYIHYQTTQGQLIPNNTQLTTTTQPLNLTITITIKE